jgi:hypothetical protein
MTRGSKNRRLQRESWPGGQGEKKIREVKEVKEVKENGTPPGNVL